MSELVGIEEMLRRTEAEREARSTDRFVDAATWLDGADHEVAAVWGHGDAVAWSSGEALLIVGPDGTGKTTIGQQLTLARIGIHAEFLGLPVAPTASRVLYVAADRPKQARRSLARMVTAEMRDHLAERLVVWQGPPEHDLARHPAALLAMADTVGADTVVLDSYKDMAIGLTDDDTGAAMNSAIQRCLANGIEVLGLHHPRKASNENKRPDKLEDVYGSRWLTAGVGSVLMLWGRAGDPIVTASHIKQPQEPVGPWTLCHDHRAGITTLVDEIDGLMLLRGAVGGVTVRDFAAALYDTGTPDRNEVERARRKLDGYVRVGLAHCDTVAKRGGAGGGSQARYYAAAHEPPEGSREQSRVNHGGVAA